MVLDRRVEASQVYVDVIEPAGPLGGVEPVQASLGFPESSDEFRPFGLAVDVGLGGAPLLVVQVLLQCVADYLGVLGEMAGSGDPTDWQLLGDGGHGRKVMQEGGSEQCDPVGLPVELGWGERPGCWWHCDLPVVVGRGVCRRLGLCDQVGAIATR